MPADLSPQVSTLLVVHPWPLPYEDRLQSRAIEQIDLVVIHCTELPDLAMAREYGERALYANGTGNSGHYYIDREIRDREAGDRAGSVHAGSSPDAIAHRFVAASRIANHTRGYNPRSIGIELVNTGRYPDWLDSRRQQMTEPYPDAQIAALIGLLAQMRTELPNLRAIAGHEDLDTDEVPASDDPGKQVRRKRDPGPLFPWSRVLHASGLERLQGDGVALTPQRKPHTRDQSL